VTTTQGCSTPPKSIPGTKTRRVSEYLLYLFFASLIFSSTLAQGVAIIIIILWIVRWITRRRFIHHPLDFAVILYLLVRSIMCFTSVDPLVSFHELRSGIFFSFIYFAITHHLQQGHEEKQVYRYLAILIYAGAVAALYGTGYVIINHFAVRAQSTAGGITRFAEYTMIVFCLAFTLSNERRIFPKRYLSYIVIALLAMGLIVAKSRAQWIAVVPVVLVVGLRREWWLLAITGGLFGILLLSVRSLRQRFATLLHPATATPERLLIWRGAREVLFKRPLRGFGPGTYRIVSPYLKDKGSWHCDYLQAYLGSGIFGFLSYLYLSFMLFRCSIRMVRISTRRSLGWAFLLTFIAVYIVGFFSDHIQEPVITPLFFSLIGFVSVLSKNVNRDQAEI
jgi:O-antigen ligase